MCTVLLPPGGYPIAVNKYIDIDINKMDLQDINVKARFEFIWTRAGSKHEPSIARYLHGP
jgi:hypothetical protein